LLEVAVNAWCFMHAQAQDVERVPTQLLAEAGHGQESVKDRQHEDKLDSIVRGDDFVN
jgi:hypothetical protein